MSELKLRTRGKSGFHTGPQIEARFDEALAEVSAELFLLRNADLDAAWENWNARVSNHRACRRHKIGDRL